MSLLRTAFYAVVLFCRGDLRNVLDGYALTGVGFDVVPVLRQFGYLDIPDKAIIDRDPLSRFFPRPFRLEYVNMIDHLLEQRAGKRLHLQKAANGIYERLLPNLECVGFGKVFTETADLVLQLNRRMQSKYLHSPLV